MLKSNSYKIFTQKKIQALISLYHNVDRDYINHDFSKEFHNFFGEIKGRIRITKRGWLNRGAHLLKQNAANNLQNLQHKHNLFDSYEKFFSLSPQNNCFRFSRAFFINYLVSHSFFKLSPLLLQYALKRYNHDLKKYKKNKKIPIVFTRLKLFQKQIFKKISLLKKNNKKI